MNAALLTIIVSPAIEEAIVDWLLANRVVGFTSFVCHGHGVAHANLGAAEQVAGRKRQIAFWIQTGEEDARVLVAELMAAFPDSGIHSWITPVLRDA